MGIPEDVFGRFEASAIVGGLTIEELDRLERGIGIDVSWQDLTELGNGTLVLKGHRVLIYIRDVSAFHGVLKEPRYHLATCKTIEGMNKNGKINRMSLRPNRMGNFRST